MKKTMKKTDRIKRMSVPTQGMNRPPIGVKPRWIEDTHRALSLTEAIHGYLWDGSNNNYDLMVTWAKELVERLEAIGMNRQWSEAIDDCHPLGCECEECDTPGGDWVNDLEGNLRDANGDVVE